MSKLDLIIWLSQLPENDPRIAAVEAVSRGSQRSANDERWLSLKEVSALTRKHVVWLARLRVPEVCGERLGGRRSYKLSRVETYLRSDACQARLAQLRDERRRGRPLKLVVPLATAA